MLRFLFLKSVYKFQMFFNQFAVRCQLRMVYLSAFAPIKQKQSEAYTAQAILFEAHLTQQALTLSKWMRKLKLRVKTRTLVWLFTMTGTLCSHTSQLTTQICLTGSTFLRVGTRVSNDMYFLWPKVTLWGMARPCHFPEQLTKVERGSITSLGTHAHKMQPGFKPRQFEFTAWLFVHVDFHMKSNPTNNEVEWASIYSDRTKRKLQKEHWPYTRGDMVDRWHFKLVR